MSMISQNQFELCTLEEATHVELNGKVHEFGDGVVEKVKYSKKWQIIVLRGYCKNEHIAERQFALLGIKSLKEVNPEPMEVIQIFSKGSHYLLTKNEFYSYLRIQYYNGIKPRWFHRLMAWLLLGWKWEDKK